MTVYAVQEPCSYDKATQRWLPRINIYNASEFGEVVTLIPPDQVNAAMVTKPTLHKLRRALRDFSDDDYILPVGDVTLVGMAIAVALRENRSRANILRWNRNERKYDVVAVAL